ncbi:hypothetical protein [Legionella sainthelensi]|uniref:hypothetical protein n=1 Tax=Legionella sainthelensi TaxID=28087 RepID=UPI002165234E|nr:hypothetical protein [Legionella sainthelensi]
MVHHLSFVSPLNSIGNPNRSLVDFINHANEDIQNINQLIQAYNEARCEEASIDALKYVLRYKQFIENKYSDKFVSMCPEFSIEIHTKLFSKLKAEFAKYSIFSLYGMFDASTPTKNEFAEILADMEPEKVNRLIDILSRGEFFDINKLITLYAPLENPKFDHFIKNTDISFLGGANSKNFKLFPKNGNPPYVLKIENRMGIPKQPIINLMRESSVKDTFIPEEVTRTGTLSISRYRETRTLSVIPFYPHGNLIIHSKKHGSDDKMRIKSALHMYQQMLSILIRLGQEGYVFPDMKNTNWLVGENGELAISDNKSLVPCIDGKISKIMANSLLRTSYLSPPEIITILINPKKNYISVDKMHAHMLGKNLYQYVTECGEEKLYQITEASQYDFIYPIFQTNEGTELQKLIEKLVQDEPEARPSLKEIEVQLHRIESLVQQKEELLRIINKLKTENTLLLNQIERCSFGDNDEHMEDFINEKIELINTSINPEELEKLKISLETILKDQLAIDFVKSILLNVRIKTNCMNNMKSKAHKIELKICNIPVEDRGNIINKDSQLGHEVHLFIASSSHFSFFRPLKKFVDSEIKEQKVIHSYKTHFQG